MALLRLPSDAFSKHFKEMFVALKPREIAKSSSPLLFLSNISLLWRQSIFQILFKSNYYFFFFVFRLATPIGQLHDDDILLQLPEFISVLLCYLNLSIPLRIKEQ